MDTQTRIGDRADSLSCLFLAGRQGIDQSVQAFTISVGEDFMFLISFSGSVWSWGRNTFGQVRPQTAIGWHKYRSIYDIWPCMDARRNFG